MSSAILVSFLYVKWANFRDGIKIGAFNVISQSMLVEKSAILGMGRYPKVNQALEKDSINVGRLAKKIKDTEYNTK